MTEIPLPPPGETSRMRATDVVRLGAAAALAAALGHVLLVLTQVHLAGRLSGTSVDFAFLAPPGYLLVFAAFALPLAVLARLVAARWAWPLVAGALATLTAFSLLLPLEMIHPLALLAAAVGVGSRVAGAASRSPAGVRRSATWVAAACASVLVLFAATAFGARQAGALRLAQSRGTAPAESPNVILLILDTVRASNLGVYGYWRETTPVLSRLAARGVAFEHAFTVSSWSAPSHASMVTGLWGSQTQADYQRPMDATAPTLGEALNRHGYAVGGFVGNFLYAGRGLGIARGFDRFEDFPTGLAQMVWSTTLANTGSGRRIVQGLRSGALYMVLNALRSPNIRFTNYEQAPRSTREVVERFWAWRDGVGGRPFFAMLNFMDAHSPYRPPDGFAARFADGTRDLDRYDGAIAYLDSVVGSIERALESRGERERTVIVVTADHGELWGEHGKDGHGNSLWIPVLHVPLVMAGGAVPAGVRVAPIVSLRDLAATILDLAGVADHALPGHSLRAAWTDGSNARVSPVIVEATKGVNVRAGNLTLKGAIRGAIDSTWHYIRYGDETEELFDWRADPSESTNLVTRPEGRREADRLLDLVDRNLTPPVQRSSRPATGS